MGAMTNLERVAAIAAEWHAPLVSVHLGWPIYYDVGEFRAGCPHEMDWPQFVAVLEFAGEDVDRSGDDDSDAAIVLGGCYSLGGICQFIDDFEAARAAMPATAFFGVADEVAL